MRIRTIKAAYNDIVANDPNTCVTLHTIRRLVVDGVVPATKSGTRFLVDLDVLQEYFRGGDTRGV